MVVFKNKRGFTLVELLATIAILGILMAVAIPAVSHLIDRSKESNFESHQKTLVMATETYMQNNSNKLPKNIGSVAVVKAETLKETNFLKEDIVNANGKKCMRDSVVRVYKYDKTGYKYTPFIYCEGDDVPATLDAYNPTIDVEFTDKNNKDKNTAKDNVSIAMVKLTYKGGKNQLDEEIAIDGYSYVISVKYEDSDKMTEIYNSGSLSAGGRKKIDVSKDITQYLDITKVSYVRVTAEAYNHDGGHAKVEVNSSYEDKVVPLCGATTNEPREDEWNNKLRKRTITVACDDGDGSGCVRDTYTKTFTKESEYGYITIKDNAGNTNQCKVRVHLDWSAPKITLNVYKLSGDGRPLEKVATVTADDKNRNVTLNKYKDGFGKDSWLNKEKFPNGVYYEVITDDNVKIGKGTWSENKSNLVKGSGDVDKLTKKYTKDFTKGDNKTTFTLVEEGFRKGKYVIKDYSDNTATINVVAPIDRTLPTVPTVGLYKKNSSDDVSNKNGLSLYNNDTWLKGYVYTEATNSKDSISGFDHYEFTTTGTTANETNKSGRYRNINAEGISYIKYRSCDVAGNCSSYGNTSTIKLDRTAPVCTNITKLGNASGGDYSSGSWYNGNIYTAADCSDTYSGCTGTKKITTTGATSNVTKQANSNWTVQANGVSNTTWYVYDNVGNERACSKVVEKIDKVKPTCRASKSNIGSMSGVNVTVSCSDDRSGVASCPGIIRNVTGTQTYTYTVKDKANNTNTCQAYVEAYTLYRYHTRGNARCTSATCCGQTYHPCSKGGGSVWMNRNQKAACISKGGHWHNDCQPGASSDGATCKALCIYPTVDCSYYTNNTCTSSCCGFTGWSGWSAWGGTGNICNTTYCQSQSGVFHR